MALSKAAKKQNLTNDFQYFKDNVYVDKNFDTESFRFKDTGKKFKLSQYIGRPIFIIYNEKSKEFEPDWLYTDYSLVKIIKWWYQQKGLALSDKFPKKDVQIINEWLMNAEGNSNRVLNLKKLLKGHYSNVSFKELSDLGFGCWESSLLSTVNHQLALYDEVKEVVLFKRTLNNTIEISVRPFTGEVSYIRTGLRISNSGFYKLDEKWDRKKFRLVTFKDGVPIINIIDQYYGLNFGIRNKK